MRWLRVSMMLNLRMVNMSVDIESATISIILKCVLD